MFAVPLVKVTCAASNQPDSFRSTTESKRKARLSAQRQAAASLSIIGFCSLDLMPILLGERSHTERLIVETASLALDANAISWQNLPVLTVTITYDDAEIFPADAKINFLSVTVESIHNPPAFFAEDEEYRAGTIVYVDNESPENLIFRNGMWTKCRSTEKTKRWQSLSKLQSRARLSKYKLNRDYTDIKDTLSVKLNLEDKALRDEPRIEWNSMNRKVIYDAGLLMMQKHINEYIFLKKKLLEWRRPAEVRGVVITKHLLHRYKYWPFQFLTVEKSSEDDEVESKTERPAKRRLYQCYIDMSELLLPGKTSTRVVAQLHSHGPSDMLEKTGLERNIFVDPRNEDLGERERKNHALEIVDAERSAPLISENGEPVFVIIEIMLYYPIIPRRFEAEFSDMIEEMMILRPPKPRYVYSGDMAEEQYEACIRKLVEILTESYRVYTELLVPRVSGR
ncbi:uncharacterized protein LOC112588999 [Harpegnathos saltator]|uniref:uncharacterized protein LOC112588999 n=1 Tax=Harpegnathos saltator TaxID=610380 RepID=UPI000DBED7BA|nr:uncharacterized protein LOC112588999 [Harpegnathos saltator]